MRNVQAEESSSKFEQTSNINAKKQKISGRNVSELYSLLPAIGKLLHTVLLSKH